VVPFLAGELGVHTLHTVRGAVQLLQSDAQEMATLERGRSAFVPACASTYRLHSETADSEVIRISLPI
jgi:mannose-6-phosphate isomerase class I